MTMLNDHHDHHHDAEDGEEEKEMEEASLVQSLQGGIGPGRGRILHVPGTQRRQHSAFLAMLCLLLRDYSMLPQTVQHRSLRV